MANLRDAAVFQDFTVWVDDVGKIGTSPNFQPPEIKIQTEEFRGGGMDGPVELPMGLEKIEFEFDLHTWDTQIWEHIGYGPGSLDVPVTFRGYLVSAMSEETGVLIHTIGMLKAIKVNKIEPGKKVDMTCSFSAHSYKHDVGGRELIKVSLFDKVYVVNGEDRMSRARQLLSIGY